MVKWESVNCIAVEWTKGVKTRYAQAANNARVVAAQVASMITFLMVISHHRCRSQLHGQTQLEAERIFSCTVFQKILYVGCMIGW